MTDPIVEDIAEAREQAKLLRNVRPHLAMEAVFALSQTVEWLADLAERSGSDD